VRIGTLLNDIVDYCGGLKDGVKRVIFGGPMMGIAQVELQIPIIKGTSGVLFLCTDAKEEAGPCIRCGACVRACPMGLLPQRIRALAKSAEWEQAKSEGVLDCMECGCCSYVCPARQSIVHYVKLAKKMLAR
jgi:electron transport complex protein RnfC